MVDDTREKMAKVVTHAKEELAGVRTSRPSPSLLERIEVDYYGSIVPLRQIAGFNVPEARLLVVTPFDKGSIGAIEKAILASDLGITPNSDGHVIRLNFPSLTEERRKELVKVVKHMAEENRVAIRNIRRSARHEIESMEKKGEISADELERSEKDLEKLTHEYVAMVDAVLSNKESELLEV
ncbi:MAG: ribosome recycling factor [Acidimicrobiales bacterium]|nr:ribosome recycling factor [Acidimicrobiales bacterium]